MKRLAPAEPFDVCVLGGGPAGSTLALRLAELGHRVCVVERDTFQRRRVGESLAPGIVPLLEALGLQQRIAAAEVLRSERAHLRWSGENPQTRTVERDGGLLVNRPRLDRLLIDLARERGAQVIQPARAARPLRLPEGGWHIPIRTVSGQEAVRARFVCDATGRRSHFATQGERKSVGPRTIALCAWFRNVCLDDCSVRVESGEAQWYWGAPLPDGTFSAMIFVDTERCTGHGGLGSPELLFRSLLAQSELLGGCLTGTIEGEVVARDASAYFSAKPVHAHFIRVGEACFGIDPLSSQGLQAAISQALHASIVVNTILTKPASTELAMQMYRDRQDLAVSTNRRFAAAYYAECGSRSHHFWRSRAQDAPVNVERSQSSSTSVSLSPRMRLRRGPTTTIVTVPGVCEDLIISVQALKHPRLDRPVAYLDGVFLAPLLAVLGDGDTASEVIQRWTAIVPAARALSILRWMVGIGAVECKYW